MTATVSSRAAYKSSKTLDPYRDFAGDKDLELTDEPDDLPPSAFAGDPKSATITKKETLSFGGGRYKNSFETQNGIRVEQVGKLRADKIYVVMGSYSFTGADGKRYRTKYTADEFGYHPITALDLDIPELTEPPPKKVKPSKSSFGGFGGFGSIANRFGGDDDNDGDNKSGGGNGGKHSGTNGKTNGGLKGQQNGGGNSGNKSELNGGKNGSEKGQHNGGNGGNSYELNGQTYGGVEGQQNGLGNSQQNGKGNSLQNGDENGVNGVDGADGVGNQNGAGIRDRNLTENKDGAGGKNEDGTNGSNKQSPQIDNSLSKQFTYGQATPPPSTVSDHTYLPPIGYLPPRTYLPAAELEYLPPVREATKAALSS